MRFEFAGMTFDEYAAKFRERGGIVEERVGVGAQEVRSPSVQLPPSRRSGLVELLSTHDQMLGGPSGQSYLGCIFPADPDYAGAISREAAKVGALLSRGRSHWPVCDRFCRHPRRGIGALGNLRDRSQPAQRRHDASISHPAILDLRDLRCGERDFFCAKWSKEISRRQRSCSVTKISGIHAGRLVRFSGAAGIAFRPGPTNGSRLSHARRARHERAARFDGGRAILARKHGRSFRTLNACWMKRRGWTSSSVAGQAGGW